MVWRWPVMLHTPLSWGCTTRQNSKGWFLFYADLDIFSLGIFFIPISTMNFPNILSSFLFTISSYIVTLQSFRGCLTFSVIFVQLWKEAQKKCTISTNQAFILRLLLPVPITELRKFISYADDISSCCYA